MLETAAMRTGCSAYIAFGPGRTLQTGPQRGCGGRLATPSKGVSRTSRSQDAFILRVATGDRQDNMADSASALGSKIEGLDQQFGIEGFISMRPGQEGSPSVLLQHPNGSTASIDLMGARVTSWKKPSGKELLYTAEPGDYSFTGGSFGRGGVTLAFPQFGDGRMGRDGFLQDMEWELVGSELGEVNEEKGADPAPGICMRAVDTPETRSVWPYSFQVEYQVNLMEMDDTPPDYLGPLFGDPQYDQKYSTPNPYSSSSEDDDEAEAKVVPGDDEALIWTPEEIQQQLRFMVLIKNTDTKPIKFTTGLRPLLAVKNMGLYGKFIRVLGLGGKYSLDYVNSLLPRLRVLDEDFITFGEAEMDTVAVDVFGDNDVLFCPGDRSHLSVHNRDGFKDIAVWNPAESFPYQHQDFVSLGSARVARVITLQPGEEWYGESVYRAHDMYWDQMSCFKNNPRVMEGIEHPPQQITVGEDQ